MTSEVDKSKSTNKILIVALIIASFFLGSLTNKVSYLEKGKTNLDTKTVLPKAAAPNDSTAQPAKGKMKLPAASCGVSERNSSEANNPTSLKLR